MSTMCAFDFEKNVLKWLLKCIEKKRSADIEDIKNLSESLGFVASIEIKPKENEENVEPQSNIQYLTITKFIPKPEKQEPIESEAEASIKDPANNTQEPVKSSLFSPQKDQDFSLIIATSSPIKQISRVSDKLSMIITLAKEALEAPGEGNTTYNKPPFLHKRISDIKISPLALSEESLEQHVAELNVTKTKDAASVLKSTPKKGAVNVVKPGERKFGIAAKFDDKKQSSSSLGFKKSLLQPVQSKFQSLQSKLRTPTNMRTASPTVTKSAGPRINLPPAERRLATTPIRRETPAGLSRLKYPSTLRK